MRRTGVIAISAVSLALLYALPANAVHDEGIFQLDGNASTADDSTPSAAEDWDLICKAHLTTLTPPGACELSSSFTVPSGTTKADPSAFVADPFDTGTDTIYTTGSSKDDLDVSKWKFKNAKPSPSKDDLEHSFAAEYVCTAANGCTDNDNDKFLYFGADRFDNEGDANIAFWFLQGNVALGGTGAGGATCANNNGCSFTGNHVAHGAGLNGKICYPGQTGTIPGQGTNGGSANCPADGTDDVRGDVLVVSAFTNGGAEPNISAYEWVGSKKAPNDLKVNAEASVVPIPLGTATLSEGCATSGLTDDPACAMVNAGETASPWVFHDKDVPGDNFQDGELYEGGLNLTKLGLAKTCFSSFLVNSRSSQSVDASLQDFTFGALAQCQSSLATTPKLGNGDSIPSGGASIGTGSLTVKDSANLVVSGIDTWSGNLKFFLCGPPSVDSSTATCDGTTGKVGTQIGASAGITVNQGTATPILSDAATITSAGRYCWRGVFTSATSGVDSRTDSSLNECFTVNPVTPTLTTSAGADVLLGNPVTDSATLSGTANRPGTPVINPTTAGGPAQGTITFKLYGPGSCTTLATGFPSAGITRSVSGDDTYPTASQTAVSFTPQAVGTYFWKAVYSGDSPNTNASSEHNTNCDQNGGVGETDEEVVVSSVPTTTTTRQSVFPQDRAKIAASVGGNLTGSVSFRLYDTLANCQADGGTAATGLLYSEAGSSHPISGASPQFAQTNNTTFRISSDATVYWNVQYDSTNIAQDDSGSTCVENTAVDFTGDDSTITYP